MSLKKNILIIDPDSDRLPETCRLFVEQGYQVWPADSCELATVSIGVKAPDLILIDVKPEIDAFEFCKRIKGQDKFANIPIIFLSFTEKLCFDVQCFKLGKVNFVPKPFQCEELFLKVKNQIKEYNSL
ncbi:MAG: response regulator [Flavobacteriaceae bacterium]|nr:response regulator [Flavobacteriaceae bacterium]